jgi:predicted neuraminidase
MVFRRINLCIVILFAFVLSALAGNSWALTAHHSAELIFPLESWHNHGSCIVECPNGDLLVCWFHGSGERKEDDVAILGARKIKATGQWTKPFLMADTPGFPDTNCCMIIDPQKQLWLLWPTIQAHTWESALMKYKTSNSYMQPDGPPEWDVMKVLHMKPGDDFKDKVEHATEAYLSTINFPAGLAARVKQYSEHNYRQAEDKLTRRLGWFTRAHPYILDGKTMLVGLYSDGFSFSLVALTDDWGQTWRFSDPIVGGGNIQPSFARKPDGTLVTYMRDNGPPPKRVLVSESRDDGISWSTVYDHPQLANPGAGLEIANLDDGDWICIYNDTEEGRHRLAVSLSSDQGTTWPITRHLELDEQGKGRFHYPSIIQAADGTLHATYSNFVPTPEGERKSIKYTTFNKAWILQDQASR